MLTDHAGQTNFFDANMNLLKKNHPHIWTMIKKNPPKPLGEIILAQNGEPNLWADDINGNRVSLHIPENPGAEANDIFNIVKKEFNGTLIITGMGLGFWPLALIEQNKNLRHLIVFEPNAGIFLQALKAMDLTPLFSDLRVILSIGEDQDIATVMNPATNALQLEDIQHVKHNLSFSLDFSKYNTIYEEINNYTSSSNIEGNTFLSMGNDFFTNRLKNLNSIHHDHLFDDLKNKYKDIPAIIVAAGPSLDKSIHLLKQVKDNALILVVDAALPSLVTNDIMPDFLTTIDPLELIYEKVASVANKARNVSLICMSWSSSKMTKLFPAKKTFWCFGGKPVERWMAGIVGCKTLTAGASSVAHLNLISAIWMGCSPIIFVGQDLSFSKSKSHASNAALSAKDHLKKTMSDENNVIWLDGIHGEKVLSDRVFRGDKLFFERIIKEQEGNYINSTAEGCHIEGTKVMPLQEAIDTYCTDKIDTKNIHALHKKYDPSILREHLIDKLQGTIKKCQQIQKMLKVTKQLITDFLKVLNKNNQLKIPYKNFNDFSIPNQKKILKLDKIGKKLDDATDIWPLMQEVTMAGLRQSEQQKHAIDLLANDPEQYTRWLKNSFQRLMAINNVRKEVLPLFLDTLKDDVKFLKSEGANLTKINRQEDMGTRNQQILKLIRLYFNADNIALAQPWLQKISETMQDSPEINLFLGITAAHYTEYAKAESFFSKAIKADPAYISQIKKFRERQGDDYISYTPLFNTYDKAVARKLLLKGLIYAPEHKKVQQELKLRGDQAIIELKNHETEGTLSEAEDMIDSWLDDLASTKKLASIIGDDHASQLNYYKGVISVDKENFNLSIVYFNKALDITPDNPVLHISLTDAYFANTDYTRGIDHLKQAVSLDSGYAVYWEEIGDELLQSKQFEDAIAAFENCFLILPERVHLLKKIGDCYKEAGQLEAAKEAYTKLNSLLKES